VAALDCVGDVDDIFYDLAAGRIYVSGGDGRIDVFRQLDADRYERTSETPTAVGARTSFLVPQRKALCVAVPSLLLRPAELRMYEVEP
jgi:hypothetical protein